MKLLVKTAVLAAAVAVSACSTDDRLKSLEDRLATVEQDLKEASLVANTAKVDAATALHMVVPLHEQNSKKK